MTSFLAWFCSSAADSLCWSLLHSLWQGLIWSLLLALLLAVIPRSKPLIRYSAGLCCLMGLAMGVLVTWSILRLPVSASPSVATAIMGDESVIGERSPRSLPSATVIPPDNASPIRSRPGQIDGTGHTTWQRWLGNLVDRFRPLLLGIWAFGVMLSLLRCVRDRTAAAAWKRGEPVQDPAALEILSSLKKRMKIRRPVRLIASLQALGPCVVGTLSPTILIPASLVLGMTPEQWRAVLTHELAHIRRWDDLVNFGQQVLESLLFFNPAVWWISRQVRAEREACCDAWEARLTASPINYAQVLVEIAEKITANRRTPALAFADERSGSLMDRVRRLVSPERANGGRLTWPASLALLVTIILAVVLLQKGSDLAVFTAAQFLTDQERVTELAKVADEVSPQAVSSTERLIISGTLSTEDGGPLSKSTWIHSQTQNGNSGIGSTQGDVKGEKTNQFRVDVPAGVTWLQFVGEGYATAIAGPFVSGRSAEVQNVSVVLKRGVPVTVRIIDDAGQPVFGANVSSFVCIERNRFGIGKNAETDPTGHTVLNNVDPQRNYSFTVTAPGFQKLEVPGTTLTPDAPLQLQMARAQLASGKVLGPDGAPLAGAALKTLRKRRHQYTDTSGRGLSPLATSNQQGEFVLDQLLDGYVYDFLVEHPDYAYAVLRSVQPGSRDLVVQLREGVSVSGVIRGTPEQFEHLKKASLGYRLILPDTEFRDADELSFNTQLKLAPVNGEASFQIDHLPLGKLIIFLKEQRFEQSVTAPISDLVINLESKSPPNTPPREVEFVFRKEGEIVMPEGKLQFLTNRRIPGGEIQQRHEDVTLVAGRVVTHVPVPCELRMTGNQLIGFTLAEEGFKTQIPEGDEKYIVEIPVGAAGAVRGVVLNPDGTPASGVNVILSTVVSKRTLLNSSKQWNMISVQTNAAGEFFISPVPFGAKCDLRASREKFFLLGPEFTMSEHRALPDFKLQFNTPVSAGVRVLDPKGHPLRGVPVLIRCEHPRITTSWAPGEATNAQGEVLIPQINPEMVSAYQAIVTPTKDYRNQVVPLQAGRTIDVTLQPGLFLEGTLVHKSGRPVSGQKLTAGAGKYFRMDQNQYSAESVTDQFGRFRFSNLPDEEVQIQIEYGRRSSADQKFMPTPENQITPITIQIDY